MDNILQTYYNFQQKTQKTDFDLKYMALGLGGEVGEIQNEIKKMERDDNNILTSERRNKIITEMGGKKKKAKKAGDGEEVDPLEELRKKYKKVIQKNMSSNFNSAVADLLQPKTRRGKETKES